jgi:hypothetical protein
MSPKSVKPDKAKRVCGWKFWILVYILKPIMLMGQIHGQI